MNNLFSGKQPNEAEIDHLTNLKSLSKFSFIGNYKTLEGAAFKTISGKTEFSVT